MSSLCKLVRQCAVSTDDATVVLELICSDAYMAEVLADDLVSRLKTDRLLVLTIRAGEVVEEAP